MHFCQIYSRRHSEGMGKVMFSQASVRPIWPTGGGEWVYTPFPGQDGGNHLQRSEWWGWGNPCQGQNGGGGYPLPTTGWEVPHPVDRGYPICLTDWIGYLPDGAGWGHPHRDCMGVPPPIRTGWRYPPPPIRTGWRQSSRVSTCATRRRYASCVHAGAYCCFNEIVLFK